MPCSAQSQSGQGPDDYHRKLPAERGGVEQGRVAIPGTARIRPRMLSSGDYVAIAVAVVANIVTIYVTSRDRASRAAADKQQEEWRRAQSKHDRIHGHFAGIVFAARTLEAMATPILAKPGHLMTEKEFELFKPRLDEVMRMLADAVSSLTVEGMPEQVETVNKVVEKFFAFRLNVDLLADNRVEHFHQMIKDANAIKAL